MVRRRFTTTGFLMTDLIVALTLLGLIFAGLAVTMHGFGAFNRYQWARQQCLAAAQAQLDSVVARGTPIDSAQCERLWPGVTTSVQQAPGVGQWEGLQLIEVTATAQAGPRQTTVALARYVPPPVGGQSL